MFECLGYDLKDVENSEFKTSGLISNSIVQNWTQSAFECYKLNCDCSICPINNNHYSFKCRMKNVVDTLIKTQGVPEENSILNQDRIIA